MQSRHWLVRLPVLCTLILCLTIVNSLAVTASPNAFIDTQPDGTEVELRIRGDEYFHWLEDPDKFTVIKDKGWYFYAEKGPAGNLLPSALRAGVDNPKAFGMKERVMPSAAVRNKTRALMAGGSGGEADAPEASLTSGTLKNLVGLLRFSDHVSRTVPSNSDVDILMNTLGGDPFLAPTGSVKDYYNEVSYGQLNLDSTVTMWIDLPNTESYYANGESGLTSKTHEALRYALDELNADSTFNFDDFDVDDDGYIDAITFLHSGYGAEWGGAGYQNRIWSHKWSLGSWTSSEGVRVTSYNISPALWGTSGSNIGRIGVICHELGHFLGLPDLYDTVESGDGIGSYGLMANSWGFDGTQKYPPHMSAWSKIKIGWVTPTLINSAGNYSIEQVETNAKVYKVDLGYDSGEYLLIENRQPVSFDGKMPQGGLVIFHIDDTAGYNTEGYPGQVGWPQNGNHYRVALLQADGNYNLEKGNNRGDSADVYHGAGVAELGPDTSPNTDGYKGGNIIVTNNRIYNISNSGSSMTFSFVASGDITIPKAPQNFAATSDSFSEVNLNWGDQSSNETAFKIERSTNGGSWSLLVETGANVTTYSDSGLNASTTYLYRIWAYNSAGNSEAVTSNSVTTGEQPLQIYRYAEQDIPVAGSVVGSYSATIVDGGTVQSITEIESGGKPSRRYSYLDHRWSFFDIRGGNSVNLVVNGWAAANTEDDNFEFQYSTDGGANWEAVMIIENDTSADYVIVGSLPNGLNASMQIRVVDTDATRGNRHKDTLYIDQMYIVTDLDPNDTTPAAPELLTSPGASSTAVQLSWGDRSDNELGFNIYRSEDGGDTFLQIGSTAVNVNSYTDSPVQPGMSCVYRVSAFSLSYESPYSNNVTVAIPDGISLSYSSFKQKGSIVVDLEWSTGNSTGTVTVRRKFNIADDYLELESGMNSELGVYRDPTGIKRGTIYYQLIYACDGFDYYSNEIVVQ